MAAVVTIFVTACSAEVETEVVRTEASNEPTAAVEDENAAYFVFNYRISDREAYDPYLADVPKMLEAHDAEIIVADFESSLVEGDAGEVTVVLKFASKEAAENWYQSPQYQSIIALRTENSVGIATIASTADN